MLTGEECETVVQALSAQPCFSEAIAKVGEKVLAERGISIHDVKTVTDLAERLKDMPDIVSNELLHERLYS